MKKKFLFLMALLAVSLLALAEMRVFVYKKDGTKTIFMANKVDSIGFVEFDANDYEYVDLGLPSGTLWAKSDLGKISEYSSETFAWGEIESKEGYHEEKNYKWYNTDEETYTKYCLSEDYGIVDNRTKLEPSDDVASVRLGGEWRIPTKEDWQELIDNCSFTFYPSNIVGGDYYILESIKNGETIKISGGSYWYSNTVHIYSSVGGKYSYSPRAGYADFFTGSSGSITLKTDYRYRLKRVRPVLP